jgi:hypothetical protein
MSENDPLLRKLILKCKQDRESVPQKKEVYVSYDSQNYFLILYSPTGVYNGDLTCFLWGTNWIRKCYLDWHQTSRAVITYGAWSKPHLAVIDLACQEMLLQISVSTSTDLRSIEPIQNFPTWFFCVDRTSKNPSHFILFAFFIPSSRT